MENREREDSRYFEAIFYRTQMWIDDRSMQFCCLTQVHGAYFSLHQWLLGNVTHCHRFYLCSLILKFDLVHVWSKQRKMWMHHYWHQSGVLQRVVLKTTQRWLILSIKICKSKSSTLLNSYYWSTPALTGLVKTSRSWMRQMLHFK